MPIQVTGTAYSPNTGGGGGGGGGGSARFFGDPGVGNVIMGFSVQGGQQSLFTALAGSTKLNAPYGCARLYVQPGGLRVNDVDFHTAAGRATHSTIDASLEVTGGWPAISTRTGNYAAFLTKISNQILARPKVPIFITWVHEPEVAVGSQTVDDVAKQQYRLAKRNLHIDLKNLGCANYVHVDCCYMNYTFLPFNGGRDWRFWSADWKGTTTSGDWRTPNPLDFYQDTDSVTELIGVDSYNFWGNALHPTEAWSNFIDKFGLAWNALSQIFTCPFALGEYACGEYDVDRTYTAPVWNAAGKTLTQSWVSNQYSIALAKNVALMCWFGSLNDSHNLDNNNAPASTDPTVSGPWRYPILHNQLGLATTKIPAVT